MKPTSLLLIIQEPAIGFYINELNPVHIMISYFLNTFKYYSAILDLSSGKFASGFPIKILCKSHVSKSCYFP
jgi:hypothetical protein